MTDQTTAAVDEADLPPLRPPSADNGLMAVFQRRYLLRLLVRREISARYQGSFLGLIWSYINPLTQFFIYWFVFGVIFNAHKDVPNYPIHLFAGLIIVHFFTETFSAGTRSISRNKALAVKQAMPREMFPVVTMMVSLYHVVPQIVILILACTITGWTPDAFGVVALVLALLIIMALGTACALLFSAANVFFTDFGNIVNVFNHFVRYGVTMMFPWAYVSAHLGDKAFLFLLNPLADAVLLFQRASWYGTATDEQKLSIEMPEHLMAHGVGALLGSLVFLVIAQLVFAKLDKRIPERL